MFRLYWKAFRDKAIRYSMNTYRMKKIMLLSPLEIGAAQLRSVTEIAPKSPFLMCEQKPYLVWFSRRRKSYLVYCEHSLSWF